MKTSNTPLWSRVAMASLGCCLLLTWDAGSLNAVVIPGPDDTICMIMGNGCRDERSLVDTCRHTPQEGCAVGGPCYAYALPYGTPVCWACIFADKPVSPSECYCAGTRLIVQYWVGGNGHGRGCQNDQGPCYCSYDEQSLPGDVPFYSCSPPKRICS